VTRRANDKIGYALYNEKNHVMNQIKQDFALSCLVKPCEGFLPLTRPLKKVLFGIE
jgi:hypothetical protein